MGRFKVVTNEVNKVLDHRDQRYSRGQSRRSEESVYAVVGLERRGKEEVDRDEGS